MLERIIGIGCLGLLGAAAGASASTVGGHDLLWDLRARSEIVDDDKYDVTARAHTVRARVGYRLRPAEGWQLMVEGEHIEALGNRYNSTANGATRYPVIADPEATELNQAWLGWHGGPLQARIGRQRITLENQRHVGNVGWRQNEQTYDAAHVAWQAGERATLTYTYLDRVQRIHSHRALDPLLRERDHDSHLLGFALSPAAEHRVAAYAYLLEDRDRAADSTATYGLRWTGAQPFDGWDLRWTLETARQQDRADHPGDFALWYALVEPHVAWRGIDWKLGWERLGGDGERGYATPLATLYAFNGWADKFLVTPPDGLVDRYASVAGRYGRLGWNIAVHDYRADRGGASYGRELDAGIKFPLPMRLPVVAALKVVDYRERGFASDTRKFVLQLEWKGSRSWDAQP